MTYKEPGGFDFPLDNPEFLATVNSIMELPPEALADENVTVSISESLSEIIYDQRALIGHLDALFNEDLTTDEALEALAEAGISVPDPNSVKYTLDAGKAQLSKMEEIYQRLTAHISALGLEAIAAHMKDFQRVRRTVDAISDRYDDLINEEGS